MELCIGHGRHDDRLLHRERTARHESLLPEAGDAGRRGTPRSRRSRRRARRYRRVPRLVSRRADDRAGHAAVVDRCARRHRFQRRDASWNAQCAVPRRRSGRRTPGADLVLHHADRLPLHSRPRASRLGVPPEPDGGCPRRLTLVCSRRARTERVVVRFAGLRFDLAGSRDAVFPPQRAPLCGHPLMSDHAVELRDVSKRYYLGDHLGSGRNLRDVAASYLAHRGRPPVQVLWALRNVTLDVTSGEAIGLVGRNGAGKTTMLRIVTRISEPTSGISRTRGRVGSLLEVGTGFHPDLTGRENVYLNGAILGMARSEIRAKFDAIVEFAEVARFLDTPVKRYSSGMYLRLAFSVAAHLDGEILLVDEVLAVGDVAFQRKCLGKMQDVSRGGRTVLFVTHNMMAASSLCQRGLLIDACQVRAEGPIEETLKTYLSDVSTRDVLAWYVGDTRREKGLGDMMRFTRIEAYPGEPD